MAGSKNLGKVGMTTGGEYSSSATYKKLTIVKHNGSQWISKTDVPSGNAPSADSTYWQLMHGTTDLKVLMTGDTASLDPNKVYVWEEAVTNLTITALNGGKEGRRNRYVFQFKNPKTAYTVLTLPSGVLWSSDTELDDNGVPVLDRDGCTRVEIVDNLATAKRWPSIYIIFEDPDVEAVLMSNGVSSDGIGITRKDARDTTTFSNWFLNNTNIVSFAETSYFGLKTLATNAFSGCSSLVKVGAFNGVETLGGNAFRYCSVLAWEVAFPNLKNTSGYYHFQRSGVTGVKSLGNITVITLGMFLECKALTYVNLPETIITIGSSAFNNCTSLSKISAMPNVTTVETGAFRYDSALAIEIDLPKLTSLGYQSFQSTGIVGIKSLGNITTIGLQTFQNCKALTYAHLPTTLTSIQNGAFNSCSALSEVTGIENVEILGDSAFRDSGLAIEIDLPKLTTSSANYPLQRSKITAIKNLGVTATLPFYFCAGCSALRYAITPATITQVMSFAFQDCTALQAIIFKASAPPTLDAVNAFKNSNNCPIYVPDASVESYKAATNWNDTSLSTRIKGISDLQTDNPELYAEIQDYL